MKFFARRSSNSSLNLLSSSGGIRYGAMGMGPVLGNRSIEKLTSLSGGNLFISKGNTSGKSSTVRISPILVVDVVSREYKKIHLPVSPPTLDDQVSW